MSPPRSRSNQFRKRMPKKMFRTLSVPLLLLPLISCTSVRYTQLPSSVSSGVAQRNQATAPAIYTKAPSRPYSEIGKVEISAINVSVADRAAIRAAVAQHADALVRLPRKPQPPVREPHRNITTSWAVAGWGRNHAYGTSSTYGGGWLPSTPPREPDTYLAIRWIE